MVNWGFSWKEFQCSHATYHYLFRPCCTLKYRHRIQVNFLLLGDLCKCSSAQQYRLRWFSCHKKRSSWPLGRRHPGTEMGDHWHLRHQPLRMMPEQRYRKQMKCAWWAKKIGNQMFGGVDWIWIVEGRNLFWARELRSLITGGVKVLYKSSIFFGILRHWHIPTFVGPLSFPDSRTDIPTTR